MEAGRKPSALVERLVRDLSQRFEGRVPGVDEKVARCWGEVMALARRQGADRRG